MKVGMKKNVVHIAVILI